MFCLECQQANISYSQTRHLEPDHTTSPDHTTLRSTKDRCLFCYRLPFQPELHGNGRSDLQHVVSESTEDVFLDWLPPGVVPFISTRQSLGILRYHLAIKAECQPSVPSLGSGDHTTLRSTKDRCLFCYRLVQTVHFYIYMVLSPLPSC